MVRTPRLLAIALSAALAGLALGQTQRERPAQGEEQWDAWQPHPNPRTAPPRHITVGPFTSHQVNVTLAGQNILDDAANEPSIAADPRNPNRLVMGWRQFNSIESSFRQAGVAFSRDGGRTWRNTGPLDAGTFRSDPVVRASAEGLIYYYSLTSGPEYLCDLFLTSNAGADWTPPIPAYGGDKAWIAIDRTQGPGHQFFYAAWDWAGCCGGNRFTRSTDLGTSFLDPIPLPDYPSWGTLAIDPDGAVYVAGNRNNDLTNIVVAKSSTAQDGQIVPGWDFSRSVNLGGRQRYFISNSPNPEGLLGQVWIVADHSNGPLHGNVYMLCSVDPTLADPLDVMFSRSTDGGQTWSWPPTKVNVEAVNANAWQWFGTMGVAPNGRIDVAWADTEGTSGVQFSILRYSASFDGGISWTPPVAISPEFDSWLGWPNQHKLGDYYDIESDAVGAHLAYAATFNGEQDVYYLRIGDYDCNQNGIGDALDISNGASSDENANGIPDECECIGDVNGDLVISQSDLGELLVAYGATEGDPNYSLWSDLDGDGAVGQGDLGLLLAAFGSACP